jgi:hypothetical protein
MSVSRELRTKLSTQHKKVDQLRELPFDNSIYNKWRRETGEVLSQLFGQLDLDIHPCVQAFLAYRIPEDFSASHDEMQEYYQNILRYQSSLLAMYLEDMKSPSDD